MGGGPVLSREQALVPRDARVCSILQVPSAETPLSRAPGVGCGESDEPRQGRGAVDLHGDAAPVGAADARTKV